MHPSVVEPAASRINRVSFLQHKIHALGFWYVLIPVGIGIIIMLTVVLIVNNMVRHPRYPGFRL